MEKRILIQLHNITPPTDLGIRILDQKHVPSDRIPVPPTIQLHKDHGGCRTDEMLWELSEHGFYLVDVHLAIRNPNGKRIPVLNYTYSNVGRRYLFELPLYEKWCDTHIPTSPRFVGASADEREAILLSWYQKWCEELPLRFQDWTDRLLQKSWTAGRVFAHTDMVCVNLTRSMGLCGDDQSLSISQFIELSAEELATEESNS